MALPLDIRDLLSSGARLRADREKPVALAVFVDVEAAEPLVDAVKEALRPQMSTARLQVEPVLPGDVVAPDQSVDAVIALVGSGDSLRDSLAHSRGRLVPTVLLSLDDDRELVSRRFEHPLLDTLTGESGEELIRDLGRWLADRVVTKRFALAANFPFVRRAVAEESVRATAFQNGVVGGVAIIPGADMPLMTANQAKMVLQIAAAYGQQLGAERVKELAVVVGGAFAMRTAARQVIGLIPGFGWAVKAAFGYSGTLAMGYAAIDYFEHGGDIHGLATRLGAVRDRVINSRRSKELEAGDL